MKFSFGACIVILLYSCTGSKADNSNTNIPLRKDSLLAVVPAANALAAIDRSPMDIAYFPTDYPVLKTSGKIKSPPQVRVIYSRPHRQGRTIFGDLVPFGQPWRLGANEATEIELFTAATIQNKKVPIGRYIMYCIPQQDKWTIIFNNNLYTWGLNPAAAADAFRFDVAVTKTEQSFEHFTIAFAAANGGAHMVIAWEQAEARLPFQF